MIPRGSAAGKFIDWFGQYAASFTIFAYPQWRLSHNKHHAHTNETGEDPDLDILFHAFTVEQLAKVHGLKRFLTKYQHWLFYPIRSLLFITTRVDGAQYFLKAFRTQNTVGRLKAVGPFIIFVIGLLLWFVAPFVFFPFWKAVTFFLVANFFQGFYASNIFASNHKAMPQIPKGFKISFLEQQIETSRNVRANQLTDFLFLCLNYQIEHHLFPGTPRPNIKKIKPFVQKLCRKHKLSYTCDSILETNRLILAQLQHVEELV